MKTSIYLPDDLADEVRAHSLPMSEICQNALRKAVADAEAVAAVKAQVGAEVEPAVVRLRALVAEEERARQAVVSKGRELGMVWARDYATPAELREITRRDPPRQLQRPHTMFRFYDDYIDDLSHTSLFFGSKAMHAKADDPWWLGFLLGAADIWQAVQPLLAQEPQQ